MVPCNKMLYYGAGTPSHRMFCARFRAVPTLIQILFPLAKMHVSRRNFICVKFEGDIFSIWGRFGGECNLWYSVIKNTSYSLKGALMLALVLS